MDAFEKIQTHITHLISAEDANEQIILASLGEQVEEMLATEPNLLMSMLYRLDVEESKINAAFQHNALDPLHIRLAKLIWERQKQRIQTKKYFQTPPIQDDEDWSF